MQSEIPEKLRPVVGYLERLSGGAELEELEQLLRSLSVTREDLEPVCCFNPQGYRRNRIAFNDNFELVVVCWRQGQGSHIHDHAGSTCAFKVIEGVATETGFKRVGGDDYVEPTLSRDYAQGSVCCAEDREIHQVVNRQTDGKDLITLHIYSPLLEMQTYQLAPYVRLASGGSGRFVHVCKDGRTVLGV